MQKALQILLEITVYSSILAVILLGLRALLHKKLSAKLQYAAWALLIIRLMMPVTIESDLHFIERDEPTAQEQTLEPIYESEAAMPQNIAMVEIEALDKAALQADAVPSNTAAEGVAEKDNAQSAQKKPFALTWQQGIFTAWVLGMTVTAAVLLITRHRFKKKIMAFKCAPSPEMIDVYRRCCAELGINKAPELVVCHINSPAFMGGRILIPADISSQSLRYALLHELTHYRHKDRWVIGIVNLLRCVYWFNPLIWISFNTMQTDMEIACDADVIKHIGNGEKCSYLETLLHMFTSSSMPALGMARFDDKHEAKRRIKGAFKKRQTSRLMRIVSAALALIIFTCCFTTACQPTPEEEVVVNKGEFEDKVEEADHEEYTDVGEYLKTVPESISDTYTNGYVDISVEADINYSIDPEADALPIYKFKVAELSDEQIKEWVDYFVKDRPMYKYPRLDTKEYYLPDLLDAKRGTLIDGEYVQTEESQRLASEYQALYDAAPYNEPIYLGEDEIALQDVDNGKAVSLAIEAEGDDEVVQYFVNDGYRCDFMWEKAQITTEREILDTNSIISTNGMDEAETLRYMEENVSISEDTAREMADKVVEELGIDWLAYADTENAFFESLISEWGVDNNYPNDVGLVVTYMRKVGDTVASADLPTFIDHGDDGRYADTVERLQIGISNSGELVNVTYRGICEPAELLAEGCVLMSFDEINNNAIKRTYFNTSFMGSERGKIEVVYDDIELTMGYALAKDAPDSLLFVPTWAFSGTLYYTENNVTSEQPISVTVNGIDGSTS